jgi:predicted nucleic acid-binding protein
MIHRAEFKVRVLIDSSVWVQHLRSADATVSELIRTGRVLMHPIVIGELACGALSPRHSVIEDLLSLPSAAEASHEQVLHFIEQNQGWSRGVGYSDMQLLAATAITPAATLFATDKRLNTFATSLKLSFHPLPH